ncbi:hypothetical protein ACWGFX_02715 [Streptomyces xanthophaeus]
MDLGAFSVSLAVRDIKASRAFYEKLGFTPLGAGSDPGSFLVLDPDGNPVLVDQHR